MRSPLPSPCAPVSHSRYTRNGTSTRPPVPMLLVAALSYRPTSTSTRRSPAARSVRNSVSARLGAAGRAGGRVCARRSSGAAVGERRYSRKACGEEASESGASGTGRVVKTWWPSRGELLEPLVLAKGRDSLTSPCGLRTLCEVEMRGCARAPTRRSVMDVVKVHVVRGACTVDPLHNPCVRQAHICHHSFKGLGLITTERSTYYCAIIKQQGYEHLLCYTGVCWKGYHRLVIIIKT